MVGFTRWLRVLRESFAIGFVFSILLVRAEQSGLEGGESLRFRGGFGAIVSGGFRNSNSCSRGGGAEGPFRISHSSDRDLELIG